jgi:hypothetical protein
MELVFLGDWLSFEVTRPGSRLPGDLERLRRMALPFGDYESVAQMHAERNAPERLERFRTRLQTRAGFYMGGSSIAGAELILAHVRRPSTSWAVFGPVASLPAPPGPIASQMSARWRDSETSIWPRHTANVRYGRYVGPQTPEQLEAHGFHTVIDPRLLCGI